MFIESSGRGLVPCGRGVPAPLPRLGLAQHGPAWPARQCHLSKVKRVAGEISGAPASGRQLVGETEVRGPALPHVALYRLHSLPPWPDQCPPAKASSAVRPEAGGG